MSKVNRCFFAVYSTHSERNTRMMDHFQSFSYQILSLTFVTGCVLNLLFGSFRAVRLQLVKTRVDSQGMRWLISEKHALATNLRCEFSSNRLTLT